MAYIEIIIKISEEIYKNIQSKSTEIQAEGYAIENAILNGTPLDDIKTEIIEHSYPVCYDKYSIEKGMTLTGIMQAFDKHIGKEKA